MDSSRLLSLQTARPALPPVFARLRRTFPSQPAPLSRFPVSVACRRVQYSERSTLTLLACRKERTGVHAPNTKNRWLCREATVRAPPQVSVPANPVARTADGERELTPDGFRPSRQFPRATSPGYH